MTTELSKHIHIYALLALDPNDWSAEAMENWCTVMHDSRKKLGDDKHPLAIALNNKTMDIACHFRWMQS